MQNNFQGTSCLIHANGEGRRACSMTRDEVTWKPGWPARPALIPSQTLEGGVKTGAHLQHEARRGERDAGAQPCRRG